MPKSSRDLNLFENIDIVAPGPDLKIEFQIPASAAGADILKWVTIF